MIGVSLVSRRGYFRQEISPEGDQIEQPEEWDPSRSATRLATSVCVRIDSAMFGWTHGCCR
jgi:starch phosphorylase